mgnify:CR=1 FL=1
MRLTVHKTNRLLEASSGGNLHQGGMDRQLADEVD